jgi:uncharacterized membrane protein
MQVCLFQLQLNSKLKNSLFIKAGSVDNTILLLDCIEMMFFKRRKQIPQSRLLAFIKRLSIVTLQLEPKSCALIQHTIRRLLTVI